MSLTEKGISPPRDTWFQDAPFYREIWDWMSRLYAVFPKVSTYSITISPGAVSANTNKEVTVTVTGLNTSDIVYVNKPTMTTGIVLGGARVSAANTLAVVYGNLTAGSLTPASESYTVVAIRK